MLEIVYTSPEVAARDIQALTDLVSSAIPTKIFILYTSITLRDNDMVIHTSALHHCLHDSLLRWALTRSAPLSLAFTGHLRGPISPDTTRGTAPRRKTPTPRRPPLQRSPSLNLSFLAPILEAPATKFTFLALRAWALCP